VEPGYCAIGRRYLRRHALHQRGQRQRYGEAVGAAAAARGVTRAQIALAWLRRNPVVVAPLVGASSTAQVDDAVASLDIDLTDEEAAALEAHYTPRDDFQGISDAAVLARISERIPGLAPGGA
jgi:aryl-alcohol dehydrogenase-like predicted oxidoreductase